MTKRHTFIFDVSELEFEQAGQLMVEQFVDDDGNTIEIAIAVRTDAYDIWSPPVIGGQTS
jgi:hypothetical protein